MREKKTGMTLIEIIVAMLIAIALIHVPWVGWIAVFIVLPIGVLVALISFWNKHPSIWQMRRRARKAGQLDTMNQLNTNEPANKPSATSEPAPGAASSSPQG
jgi:hypothetical protein